MKKAAQTITDHHQEIVKLWESTVEDRITASQYTNNIILRDHLPNMLDDVADILFRYDGQSDIIEVEKYQEIVVNSSDHGRHRAASKAYTIDQLIHEYIIFHRTITEVLRKYNAYTSEVGDLLKYVLETAILQSSSAFNFSLQEMQEKLVGTLAHDIRNPISTAYGLLELLGHEQDPEKIEMLRQMALRSLEKSLTLSEGLLDAITIKAGEGMMVVFAEGDLVKEIDTIYQEARHIYSQDIRFECSESEIIGIVDGTAIRRVLENLLTNAIKYGDIDRPITISLQNQGDQICLSVHNYGNPIPPEKQKSIFSYLTHSANKEASSLQSWGMGLTLVKVIAEAHNGHASLTSSEEDGTCFTIKFSKNNKAGKIRTHVFDSAIS